MTLWLFYKTLLHQKVWNINSCFHWLHQGSQAGLPNPWIAVFINTVQTGRLDQIFTWAHSGQLALMGRHIVISFNCQFVKASYSFQSQSWGGGGGGKGEYISARTWHEWSFDWTDATREYITHSQAEPAHFQQAVTNLLQNLGFSLVGTGLLGPNCYQAPCFCPGRGV